MRPETPATDLAAKAVLEERNIQLVLEMFERVLQPMDANEVSKYFRADYRQHNPMATAGAVPETSHNHNTMF